MSGVWKQLHGDQWPIYSPSGYLLLLLWAVGIIMIIMGVRMLAGGRSGVGGDQSGVRVQDCSELRRRWGGCRSWFVVRSIASEGDGVTCSLKQWSRWMSELWRYSSLRRPLERRRWRMPLQSSRPKVIKMWVRVSAVRGGKGLGWSYGGVRKNVWVKWLMHDSREGAGSAMIVRFVVWKSLILLVFHQRKIKRC